MFRISRCMCVHTHPSCGYTLCKCLAWKRLLPPQVEDSSHCSLLQCGVPPMGHMNFSIVGPCLGLQFFPNCGSFQRLQSFRNRLLHWESPQAQTSCQQTYSSMTSSLHGSTSLPPGACPMGSHPPLGISLLCCGIPMDAGGSQLHHGAPWAHPASPWPSPWAAGESPAPPSPLTWDLQGCFSDTLTPQLQLLLHSIIPLSVCCYSRCTPTLLVGSSVAKMPLHAAFPFYHGTQSQLILSLTFLQDFFSFVLRMPSLTFAARVWFQKINPAPDAVPTSSTFTGRRKVNPAVQMYILLELTSVIQQTRHMPLFHSAPSALWQCES